MRLNNRKFIGVQLKFKLLASLSKKRSTKWFSAQKTLLIMRATSYKLNFYALNRRAQRFLHVAGLSEWIIKTYAGRQRWRCGS